MNPILVHIVPFALSLILLFYRLKSVSDKYVRLTMFLCLAIYMGLRGSEVGTDTAGYLNFFDKVENFTNDDIYKYKDPIFAIYSKVIVVITGGADWFFLLVSSSIYAWGIADFTTKNIKYPFAFIYPLFAMNYINFGMSGIRQSIAMGLVFLLYGRRINYRFVVLSLLAVGFHITSILPIFLLLVLEKPLRSGILILLAVLMGWLPFSLISDRLLFSVTSTGQGADMFYIHVLIAIIFLVGSKYKGNYRLMLYLALILIFQKGVALYPELFRMVLYFSVFMWVALENVVINYEVKLKVVALLTFNMLFFIVYSFFVYDDAGILGRNG